MNSQIVVVKTRGKREKLQDRRRERRQWQAALHGGIGTGSGIRMIA